MNHLEIMNADNMFPEQDTQERSYERTILNAQHGDEA